MAGRRGAGKGATSAIVLAGGRGSRMGGQDKALLDIAGKALLQRVVERVAQLTEEVIVVGNSYPRFQGVDFREVGDLLPGKGALGGLYSGLRQARHTYSLAVACDMPFLNLGLLRYMLSLREGYEAVVPRWGEYIEALHAVYSKACLPVIEECLRRGELRIVNFLPQVQVRYVEREEIEAYDPEHFSFFNINTPADLEEARRRMQEYNV